MKIGASEGVEQVVMARRAGTGAGAEWNGGQTFTRIEGLKSSERVVWNQSESVHAMFCPAQAARLAPVHSQFVPQPSRPKP